NGAYVACVLNNFTKYNNSSAQFTTNPLPYICNNTFTTYLNGMYSPDGDSVRVYPQRSLQGAGAPDGYNAGYSLANPVGSSTGYFVDSASGTAYFTPVTPGAYVLGFRGEEYERGTGTF